MIYDSDYIAYLKWEEKVEKQNFDGVNTVESIQGTTI